MMLISCNSAPDSSDKKIIRFNSATGITSLDPAFARTQENIRAVNQLFNGLVELDSQLNISPAIAKSWSISEDAKTYTFVLNNEVFFHNDPKIPIINERVTATDFEYSFYRIIDKKTASDGAWIFNDIVNPKDAFKALNDTVFQINLKKPYAPLLNLLTMAYCYVVPQKAVEFYGNSFGKNPVGTGPFQFANWSEGIKLNFIKNENYFESKPDHPIPLIDAISITFNQSKQTELLHFFQGNLDLFNGIESSFKDEILTPNGKLNPKYVHNFELQKNPFLNTEYLAFNMEDSMSPVCDVNFRKAIHHAIDRETMIDYLRNGIGKSPNGGFSPRGLPAHVKSDETMYNLELAQEYLSKCSIKQTKPLQLTTTSNYLDLCILVQNNCAKIGIQISINVVPASLLKQSKSTGELSFFRSSWIADYPDGENYMACFYGPNKAPNGPNYTRFSNHQFDTYYTQLINTTDLKKRKELYQSMEKLLAKEQPFILLYYDESIWIKSNKVSGIRINALNHLDLRNANILSLE